MTNLEIHEHAVGCAKDLKRSESAILEALQWVDEKKVFLERGYTSLHGYAVGALGLADDEAYKFTRVARKAVEVPQLKEAIQQGKINVSQARRIASVIDPQFAGGCGKPSIASRRVMGPLRRSSISEP